MISRPLRNALLVITASILCVATALSVPGIRENVFGHQR